MAGANTGRPRATSRDRDLGLETLALVLDKKIPVQMHCYRADQMATMIDVMKEFGFRIAAFHHAAEAYKVADLLKANDICAVMWADWWGFKMEAYDGIPENIAMVDHQGACAMIHSDDPLGIQRLNQEVARRWPPAGAWATPITRAHAVKWMTANPAKALGILDKAGTLEDGKMADVVMWDGDPFSVYSHAEKVFIDGALLYDRDNPALSPRSDFELGQEDNGHTGGAGQ